VIRVTAHQFTAADVVRPTRVTIHLPHKRVRLGRRWRGPGIIKACGGKWGEVPTTFVVLHLDNYDELVILLLLLAVAFHRVDLHAATREHVYVSPEARGSSDD
jgi:hypothetical protein